MQNSDVYAQLSRFKDNFSIMRPKGIDYDRLGISSMIINILMIVLGGELLFVGTKHEFVNLSIVIMLYVYENLVQILDKILKAMKGSNIQDLQDFAQYISQSNINMFVMVLAMTLLISGVVMMLLNMFLMATMIASCMFLFSRGPGAGILIYFGIENIMIHLVCGFVLGVIIGRLFNKKIQKGIYRVIFVVVGLALIAGGICQIAGIEAGLPYAILNIEKYNK